MHLKRKKEHFNSIVNSFNSHGLSNSNPRHLLSFRKSFRQHPTTRYINLDSVVLGAIYKRDNGGGGLAAVWNKKRAPGAQLGTVYGEILIGSWYLNSLARYLISIHRRMEQLVGAEYRRGERNN